MEENTAPVSEAPAAPQTDYEKVLGLLEQIEAEAQKPIKNRGRKMTSAEVLLDKVTIYREYLRVLDTVDVSRTVVGQEIYDSLMRLVNTQIEKALKTKVKGVYYREENVFVPNGFREPDVKVATKIAVQGLGVQGPGGMREEGVSQHNSPVIHSSTPERIVASDVSADFTESDFVVQSVNKDGQANPRPTRRYVKKVDPDSKKEYYLCARPFGGEWRYDGNRYLMQMSESDGQPFFRVLNQQVLPPGISSKPPLSNAEFEMQAQYHAGRVQRMLNPLVATAVNASIG